MKKHVRVLQLNKAGRPIKWITPERAAKMHFKDQIAWSMADENIVMRGGVNRSSGKRSVLDINPIIAIKGKINGKTENNSKQGVLLNSHDLFARDNNTCAYCGSVFTKNKLTVDHIIAQSKGGTNAWENVVTSCGPCNQKKSDRPVDGIKIKLLYSPYVPCQSEILILSNRNIMECQRKFLLDMVVTKKM